MNISIITVNYNNASGIKKTMASVFEQKHLPHEYIIIDGGSTDGSVECIVEYSDKVSYWVSEKDRGIYHAMNKGISRATGEYLIFLNSGDYFTDNQVIEKCIQFIETNQIVDVFYADMIVVNDVRHKKPWVKKHPSQISINYLEKENLNHQASIIRAHLFKEFGNYPEHYKLASDFWLYLKCFLNNKSYFNMNFPMVFYDLSGLSGTNYKKYELEKKKIWNELVPSSLQELIDKAHNDNQMLQYKIIKAAVALNYSFQNFKNFFSSSK